MSANNDRGSATSPWLLNASALLCLIAILELLILARAQTHHELGIARTDFFASNSSVSHGAKIVRKESVVSGRHEKDETAWAWRLPDRSPVSRSRGFLVNYFHMDLAESHVSHASDRLAQWDVVILNHDLVDAGKVSLGRIRRTNPKAKILAWVPLQGPNHGMSRGVPNKGSHDWYARKADGNYLVPHWGGNLMNPCVQDRAWLKHVLRFACDTCLTADRYDGLMLDCLWNEPPAGLDVNGDKSCNTSDVVEWREAMLFLLRELRTLFPKAILVGNGGLPWPSESPYYGFVNGCMHENALGAQFGGNWDVLWNSYKMATSRVAHRPVFHFIQVDVRADGRSLQDAMRLRTLTENDRRRLRLGLGTTLMLDGGYFGFDRGDCLHGQLWWFEEYDIDLGKPLADYQIGRFAPRVLSREFENGIVIVNPNEVSVEIPAGLGYADARKEFGSKSIQVPPWDARMLVKLHRHYGVNLMNLPEVGTITRRNEQH